MGGEKEAIQVAAMVKKGSPPRGRGKGRKRSRPSPAQRITPAWAGKRAWLPRSLPRQEDHPRVGGEKAHSTISRQTMLGSPPRGRGKVSWHDRTGRSPGITPAWAGKRCFNGLSEHRAEDHPRVGGEKGAKIIIHKSCEGSPPRGRGKVGG